MTAKKSAEVIIDGKVYTLSGYEEEGYLQKVASYINNKIGELQKMDSYRRFSSDTKATLVELNIADDYFKARDRIEELELTLEQKEKEIYDLKHDLINSQIKAEKQLKEAKHLKEEKQGRAQTRQSARPETAQSAGESAPAGTADKDKPEKK